MKRLIKKAIWPEQTYTFEDIKQLIESEVPTLFGLGLEEQAKLKKVLNTFEKAVDEATAATKLGSPKLEVGMVEESGVNAYYKNNSDTLTLNTEDSQLEFIMSASEDYIEMVAVHEYGHYVDEQLGFISQTEEWQKVISKTNTNYLEGYGVTSATNHLAEKFANAFVAWLWNTQNDSATKFINELID